MKLTRKESLRRRHGRIRSAVSGTSDRPRLAVFRSHEHIYAQIIDDTKGVTLAAASSIDTALRGDLAGQAKLAKSQAVGRLIAERAREKGISKVVFDRGGYRYHGRIKAVADAAREGGLEF